MNHLNRNISTQSLLESIDGIWKFTRNPNIMSKCNSLHSHLIHFIIEGSYRLKSNGREYDVQSGDMIYYHGSEQVEWIGNDSVVTFYSIGFSAPLLQPFSLNSRVFQPIDDAKQSFKTLYDLFLMPSSIKRTFMLFSHLNKLLFLINEQIPQIVPSLDPKNIWWTIEQNIYGNQDFRPAIDDLCKEVKCSRSTLLRQCKKATGKTPLVRIKELRMAEAKALLENSTLNITQVSEYLGYPRIHEFSREFSSHFGSPPNSYKK